MRKLYILKLGGSAITYKHLNSPKANIEVIQNAAQEIYEAKLNKEFQLIIVHGAGPFGHQLVTDFGIANGLKNEADFEGFIKTHQSVDKLNRMVIDALNSAKLLAFPVQPSACILQKSKKISSFNLDIIKALLEINNNMIPVLYGDMVADEDLKASVVSGDAIISYLTRHLNVKKVFFGANVNGIFTADPKKNKNAQFIPEINMKNWNLIENKITGSSNVDVTGGMRGKLLEILSIKKKLKILVFNITQKKNLYNVLCGNNITCTNIELY